MTVKADKLRSSRLFYPHIGHEPNLQTLATTIPTVHL
jgi:hypothetical protein